MKLVKSLITLLAVVVIGIVVYFTVYKAEQDRKERMITERRLIRFDLDRINSFTLVRPDSSVVFERGIGRIWNITEPIESEADKEPIFTLFYQLDSSDILYNVEEEPEDYSLYGLEKSDYYMAMRYDNAEPDTLFVGDATPDGTMSYVRFASEDRVLAVSMELTSFLKKPVRFYRSRSMLNVVADDIIGVEIHRTQEEKDDNTITMLFNGVTWVMMEPWDHPADQDNMLEFCEKMADAKKNTLIAEHSEDLAQYGLDEPSVVLNVNLKYGMPSKMVLIGDKLTERGKTHLWYAKQFDRDLIFTVENSVITMLNRTPVWFIDKQPAKFNRNNIDRIVLETAEEPITFFRDNVGNWSVVSPIDKNINQETVNSIFGISRFILAHDLFALDPSPEDLAAAGLDKPNMSLSFYHGDQLVSTLYYGNTFTTNKQNTYFKTSHSPTIYVTQSSVNSSINTVLRTVFGG